MFDKDTNLYPRERVTGALAVIDSNHAQVHAGKAFSLKGEIDVAQSKVGIIQITVPSGAYVHLQDLNFASNSGPATIGILEDYALTSEVGASALTPVNHHRIKDTASVLTVKAMADAASTPGSSPKTLATLPLYGSGAGSAKVAADTSAVQEYILKAGKYLLTFSHTVAGTCKFGYKFFWYEESGA